MGLGRQNKFLDIHGDPRAIIAVFGKKTAELLGFEMVSDFEMWVPDTEEINGALDELNRRLEARGLEKILLRFRTSLPSDKTVTGYTERFMKQLILPVGSNPISQIHDYAYHLSSIITPQLLLKASVHRTELFFLTGTL